MFGVVLNAISIVLGCCVGLLFKKIINSKFEKPLMQAIGLSLVAMSILGVITACITLENGVVSSNGEILILVSMSLGTFIGIVLDLDGRVGRLGERIEKRFKVGNVMQSFTTASIVYCAGALAIIGPINVVILGSDIMYMKSLLDFIVAIVLSSTMGIGVMLSAVFVFIYQGAFALLAEALMPFMTANVMSALNMVGNVVMATIGINLVANTKIKTVNMVPALIIAILFNSILL